MADSLRTLMARVAPMRPDLNQGGLVDFCIQESLRRICRETNLYRETLAVQPVLGNSDTLTVTPSNGYNIKRVEYVKGATGLFSNAAYQSGWDASTNTPAIATGSSDSTNAGQFYIVTVAGTTTVDGTSTWNVGDIIQSSGSLWTRFAIETFPVLSEINVPTVNYAVPLSQSNSSTLLQWGQTIQNPTGTIIWYPRSLYDTAVQILISEVPVGELTDIGTLPVEVEDAIVEGALAQILNLPSALPGMQNLALAQDYHMRFERSLANLKGRALLGFGASPRAIPPNFTGTWAYTSYWTM